MVRALPVVLLLALASAAAAIEPGVERAVSPPARGVNDGYAIGGAVWKAEALPPHSIEVLLSNGRRVYSAKLSPGATEPRGDAELLDIPPIARVASLPNGVVTAWNDGRRLFAGVGAKIGEVSIPRQLPVPATSYAPWIDDVATNDTHALILCADYPSHEAWASLLDANGVLVGDRIPIVLPSAVRVTEITVASDPGGFLVLHRVENAPLALHATRIDNHGTATKFDIALASAPSITRTAYDGRRYLIAMQQDAAIRGILMSPDGTSRSKVFTVDANAHLATMTGRPGGSLVICWDKAFVFEHATRTHGTDYPVAASTHEIVSDGEHVLALFANDPRFRTGTASGQWLDLQTGAPLGDSFAISYGSPRQYRPAAALGSTVDFLVWAERDPVAQQDAIRGSRVARNGFLLDQPPLRLSIPGTDNEKPAVAFNGRDFVVAWHEQVGSPNQGSEKRVRVQRIGQNGTLRETEPRQIGTAVIHDSAMKVVQADGTTLIAWIGLVEYTLQTHAVRMDRDGRVLDAAPLRLAQETRSEHWDFDVAAGNGGFLIAWGQEENGQATLHAAQISTSGTISTSQELHPWESDWEHPIRVAWNDGHFLVVWGDFATSITTAGWAYPTVHFQFSGVQALASLGPPSAVGRPWVVMFGPQLAGANRHLFLPPFNFEYENEAEATRLPYDDMIDPQIASDGTRAILVYARHVAEAPHGGSFRVMYRIYDDDPGRPGRRRPARH